MPTPFGTNGKLTVPLRLFYNFTSTTAFALPQTHNPSVLAMWTIDTPQLAFHCDYLLHAILAISAMHISYTRAPNDESLYTAMRYYFDKSIRSFQEALTDIGAHNAEQIMVTSMILGVLAGPVSRGCRIPPDGTKYELPMFTLRMIKALEGLMVKTVPFLQEANIIALLPAWGATGTQNLPRHQFLRPEDTTDLELLLQGLNPTSIEYSIYDSALEHVRLFQQACVEAEPTPKLQRKFTRFAMLMSDGFADLLEQEDPRAMVILAHQSALARFLEDTPWGWFLIGMAEYNVRGVESLLPHDGGWRELMMWPRWIVGLIWTGAVKESVRPLVDDGRDIMELLE